MSDVKSLEVMECDIRFMPESEVERITGEIQGLSGDTRKKFGEEARAYYEDSSALGKMGFTDTETLDPVMLGVAVYSFLYEKGSKLKRVNVSDMVREGK